MVLCSALAGEILDPTGTCYCVRQGCFVRRRGEKTTKMCLSLPPRLLRFNGNFDGNKVIQLWNLTFLVLIQCIFLNGGIFHFSSSPSLLLVVAHLLPFHRPPPPPFMKFSAHPPSGPRKYFLLYYPGK